MLCQNEFVPEALEFATFCIKVILNE